MDKILAHKIAYRLLKNGWILWHHIPRVTDEINELFNEIENEKEDCQKENVMIYNSFDKNSRKSFRCECGCNVFKKISVDSYKCNGCDNKYVGEKQLNKIIFFML